MLTSGEQEEQYGIFAAHRRKEHAATFFPAFGFSSELYEFSHYRNTTH